MDAREIRVLVIEDDPDSLELYKVLLESLGWRVAAADSAAAAIEAISSIEVDVILSDIGLPDGDGHVLLPALRTRAGRRVPALAITGFGLDDDLRRSLEAGFDGHLSKPIQLSELQDLVERLVP